MAQRGCFKIGCFGCLGLVAVVFVIVAALAAIALLVDRPEVRLEQADLKQALPSSGGAAEDGGLDSDTRGEVGSLVLPTTPGRIELDVAFAEFDLVAGEPGEPLHVSGNYDAGSYELTTKLVDEADGSWTFKLAFDRRGSWLRHGITVGDDGPHNRVRLVVPRGVPVSLGGTIGVGESDLELGGLSVDEVDLDLGIGAHALHISEPLPRPMGRLRLHASLGELTLSDIGNGSPQSVDVEHRIGEVQLDLRGAWKRDAEVSLRCGMGECSVRVPTDVRVELERARLMLGESDTRGVRNDDDLAPDAPTLHLSLSSKIGELRVTR